MAIVAFGFNENGASAEKFFEIIPEIVTEVYSLKNRHALKRPLSDRNPGIQQQLESFIEWSEKWYVKKKGIDNKPPCFFGLPSDCSCFSKSVFGNKIFIP